MLGFWFFFFIENQIFFFEAYNLITWYVCRQMEIVCFVNENFTKYKSLRASICDACVAL